MKAILKAIALVGCLTFSAISVSPLNVYSKDEYEKGDVDQDGTLSICDATQVQKYLVRICDFSDEQLLLADVNGDNSVNISDATAIQKIVAGIDLTGDEESDDMQTTVYTLNGVDFKMILVEAGTFTMGSSNTDVQFSESPAHKVTLTQDYLMGETEVTEALWNAVMGSGGTSSTHPKTSITWNEAHTFIDKLNELAHEQGIIADDVDFHLPTEAQWEFAAKGGNLSKGYLYSGSNNIDEVAVTYENSGSNAPVDVKTKAPNELGLYDMSGNAYEWVDDYGADYSSADQTDPQCTSGSGYVKRGGSNYHSFGSESYLFTTTGRYFYSSTDWTIGFRICLY